ncbi:MAG: nickel-dependent lactate racemase [Methanomassiliicoccales archaeon]|nr:MAG: nickel-dependent lactate racemase [Methanomassiliicoccales archaeon]
MEEIVVPYGKEGRLFADVPERNFIGTLAPKDVVTGDVRSTIERSLAEPIGSCHIDEFLAGGEDVVFIVNDGTRPTPTAAVLQVLSHRTDLSKYRYLIATGAHRPPDEEELRLIFGEMLEVVRDKIHPHDARNDHCIYLGRSKNGTEMEVNEIAVNADRLVIITSVEPHYFAGYTGGRKSFLPGVASFKCIEQNHRLAMRKEASVLRLDGNPVHEDMIDALSVVKDKKIFSVQVVMDRHQGVYKVASGDLFRAFDKAVAWANEVFSVEVKEKADMVITVAPYPMDVDLYQSQKAIDNAKHALKEGGVVLLVSKCRQGMGDDTFCRQLSSSKDPSEILRNLECEYRLGFHKAAKLAEIMLTSRIWAVTDLEDEKLRSINITPFHDLQMAVDSFLHERPEGKILVLMDGSVTVPRVV